MWPYPCTHVGTPSEPGTPGPGGRDTAFPSTCGSGLGGTRPRAVGGTGCPLGKTFFLHCQMMHPELPKIPTYLYFPNNCSQKQKSQFFSQAGCTTVKNTSGLSLPDTTVPRTGENQQMHH